MSRRNSNTSKKATYQCLLCERLITSWAGTGPTRIRPLLYHLEAHMDALCFSCNACGYAKKHYQQVTTHINRKHDGCAKCVNNRTEQEWTDLFIMGRKAFPDVIDLLNETELKEKLKRRKSGEQGEMSLMHDSVNSQEPLNDMNKIEQIHLVARRSPTPAVNRDQIASTPTDNVLNSTMDFSQDSVASALLQDCPTLVIGNNSATIHKNEVEDQPNVSPAPVQNTLSTSSTSSHHQSKQAPSTPAQSFTVEISEQDIKMFCLPTKKGDDSEKKALREKVRSLEAQLKTSNFETEKSKDDYKKLVMLLGFCQIRKHFYQRETQRLEQELEIYRKSSKNDEGITKLD
ncbi:unnamed protein product, partial [Mesorhabditis belari]|uniref:Uncharacterized protein n=1 Tax=Mesorhabditis belari TaxID=2138241 RepID=A0AAF3F7Y8_9BILA